MPNTPKEEQEMNQENAIAYDKFIRGALAVGFTDDQTDFLYDWILELIRLNPSS